MARYHELSLYRAKLEDIREIMHSMKTLAQMEAHKLTRFIERQRTITHHIQAVADDFLPFFADNLTTAEPQRKTVLLVGSERGFCGDFNKKVLRCYDEKLGSKDSIRLIAIGHKMQALIKPYGEVATLQGANVSEEIDSLVEVTVQTLTEMTEPTALYAVYQSDTAGEPIVEKLLPAFSDAPPKASGPEPELNLPPQDFLLELTDHALNHALYRLFFSSLMAENQQRIHHLENATNHLDKKTGQLQQHMNMLRQEAIIEEIEVILLNQANLASPEELYENAINESKGTNESNQA